MKRLLEEMEKNQELKAKIEELDKNPESTPKDYIRVAAEYGIEIKEEDFKPAQGELTDDELDAVAGGEPCACVFGGGGTANQSDDTCACVFGGGGEYSDGSCRCACVGGGAGDGHHYVPVSDLFR
ncbi:Nif11-like leader peptide family natural product precursor [bacterium D16-51]|nr:Nif11-like leader peptide family natural product precursor [bacterium D16-59]RKI56597.1 Nif11-like leader peptide family natural product precursor [bacterium D16-51]